MRCNIACGTNVATRRPTPHMIAVARTTLHRVSRAKRCVNRRVASCCRVMHCAAPCGIVRAVRRVNLRPRRRRPSPCRRRRASPRRSPLQCGAAARRQPQRKAEATETSTSWHHATLHQATLQQATLQHATIATCDDCNMRRCNMRRNRSSRTCAAVPLQVAIAARPSPSDAPCCKQTQLAVPTRGVQAWAGRGGQSQGADGGEPQNCSARSLRADTEASPCAVARSPRQCRAGVNRRGPRAGRAGQNQRRSFGAPC